jgi:hypothetical protein
MKINGNVIQLSHIKDYFNFCWHQHQHGDILEAVYKISNNEYRILNFVSW